MRYDLRFQVKQLRGFVINERCSWMVFETGNPKVWLFCQGYPEGMVGRNCFVATGIQNPVEKTRLVDAVRQALQAGMNIDMRDPDNPVVYSERFRLEHRRMEKCQRVEPEPTPPVTPPPPKKLR